MLLYARRITAETALIAPAPSLQIIIVMEENIVQYE
jgi:hypothetical protein